MNRTRLLHRDSGGGGPRMRFGGGLLNIVKSRIRKKSVIGAADAAHPLRLRYALAPPPRCGGGCLSCS